MTRRHRVGLCSLVVGATAVIVTLGNPNAAPWAPWVGLATMMIGVVNLWIGD